MRLFCWLSFVSGLLLNRGCAQSTTIGGVDVNVANVPDCAKVCLSNSTQYATNCAQIDVKCLCNSPTYVSALSCCIATNCNAADQQTAIQFNIQECAAVNSTAPNFVGCSPFSLTTGGASKASTATSSSSIGQATTLDGDAGTSPTAYTNTQIVTAKYAGSTLLTGTCSIPMFAEVTNSAQSVLQFPQVGCASNRGACCPFDPNQYARLTKCPVDYITTAGGCCPSGYSVYSSALGAEIPCFSRPSNAYVPASSITGSEVSVITDTVFSRKFALVGSNGGGLGGGTIAGIVVGAFVCAVAIPAVIVFFLRRYRRKQEAATSQPETSNLVVPSTEPAPASNFRVNEVPHSGNTQPPQELASPEKDYPTNMKGLPYNSPSSNSVPPAYEKPVSSTNSIPAEMPGSTHMNEHHPVFTRSQSGVSSQHTAGSPSSVLGTRSPVLSPSSPYRTDSPSNLCAITPLGSPALGASPRFREGAM